MNRSVLILSLVLFYFFSLSAQTKKARLKLDTTFNGSQLVNYILNNQNIKVNNIKWRGLSSSIAKFYIDTNAIGIKRGIVLTTGNVNTIPGQNKTPGTSGLAWDNNYRFKSDRDLNQLAKGRVADQVILEFDFIPLENHITFRYIFASEEYKEYVGSRFNDVFAFIVTGDGNFRRNLAVLPERSDPITVNNINHLRNSTLFINNNCFENYGIKKEIDEFEPRKPFVKSLFDKLFGSKNKDFKINKDELKTLNNFLFNELEFDGLTKPLEASVFLTPYKVYHMKIAIGDVGDPMFDSGVFIEEGSFTAKKNRNAPFFKEYEDIRDKVNFDSLFNFKIINPIRIDSPPQIEEEFEITNINFDNNSALIPDSSSIDIRSLALYLNKNKGYRVHILGYTDNKGSIELNQVLSEKRAKAVKALLVKSGVNEDRINYIGNNYENPLADNTSEKGRSLNRRVEILVLE
jgi:outer membrane protein OmpA-like peptidoglycan-associated protein